MRLGLTNAPNILRLRRYGACSPHERLIRMLRQHCERTIACMCLRRGVVSRCALSMRRALQAPRRRTMRTSCGRRRATSTAARCGARVTASCHLAWPACPALPPGGQSGRRHASPGQRTWLPADTACSVEAPLGRARCLRMRCGCRQFQRRSVWGGAGCDKLCGGGRPAVLPVRAERERQHRQAAQRQHHHDQGAAPRTAAPLGLLASLAAHPRMLCRPGGHTCSADQERPLVFFPCRAAQWALCTVMTDTVDDRGSPASW